MGLRDLQAVRLMEGFDHPEGLAYFDGCWYVGGEAGQLWRIPEGGCADQVATVPGMVLGVALDGRGRIYACDAGSGIVWQIDGARRRPYVQGTLKRPLVNPNWGLFSPDGSYWVSDSGHWGRQDGVIYRVSPDGISRVWCTQASRFPNGMALHPNGHDLYVVESTLPGISRVTLGTDTPQDYQIVLVLPQTVPDGLAFDEQGGLYIGYYRPDRIDYWSGRGDPEPFLSDWQGTIIAAPTNLAFGGPTRTDLWFASFGRWSLGQIDVAVPGMALYYPRG